MTRRGAMLLAAGLLALGARTAAAGEAWDALRPALYQDRAIAPAGAVVALVAPYRSMDDPRTVLGASVEAPPGALIRRVSLIIDENPMPVSAVFELAGPQAEFAFSAEMRINGPTPVRVVVETDQGALYMAESFVKTSGVGACAAPPGTDPALALQTLGQMQLALDAAPGADLLARLGALERQQSRPATVHARLAISHPSHSGMQMDQISLLYIPARFIARVEVAADGQALFTMTGSISFSENPALGFDIPAGAAALDVHLTDSDGAEFDREFPLVQG